jgi:hypothetical protein
VVPSLCLALSGCLQADDLGGGGSGTSETDTASQTDTASETDTADETYPAPPYGTEVGDTIADLVFFRGDGEALALSSYYAQPPPALIIFGTAAW